MRSGCTAYLVVWYACYVAAQSPGNIFLGSGPPVGTTYLVSPANSPFAAPQVSAISSPRFAPSLSPARQDTRLADVRPQGPCYCTLAGVHRLSCYLNETLTEGLNTTTTDCLPPLLYSCQDVAIEAGVYAQEPGRIFQCEISRSSGPAPADTLSVSSAALLAPVPAVNDQDYTRVLNTTFDWAAPSPSPNPANSIRYARTPVLEAGQILSINPRPLSVSQQFPGVDITMNGLLNGIPLEPPNPAICIGNGFLMEVTNNVLIVYSTEDGSVLAGPTDFQHFFGARGPPNEGLSDPYCLFDAADSKRFFVSISTFSCRTASCLAKGVVPIFSNLLIGVSRTSDPRDGFLGPYIVATDAIDPDTNEPYPGFRDCGTAPNGFSGKGCLGDFPNPGLDDFGFWQVAVLPPPAVSIDFDTMPYDLPALAVEVYSIDAGLCRFSMNMFTIDADNLIGANVFGVRKGDLLSGLVSRPSVVTYTDWAPLPGFTIMPSITQGTWKHSKAQGGSLYLMSSDSFSYSGQLNDSLGIPSIRTWAITNTSLLGQNFPDRNSPMLSAPVTLRTEPLQFSSAALRNPRAPSGTSVPQPIGPILGGQDERMRQVSFSGGLLYSCLNTPVNISSRIYNGLAYFVVAPNFTANGRYTARILDQGYLGTAGAHLLNGALTSTSNGSMIIAGSIVGTGMYLSAFYSHIQPKAGPGPIHVPRVSSNPLENEGPGQLPQRRTGDYSTVVLDESENVWMVAEWASDNFTRLQQPDSKNPRISNWGTYLVQLNPYNAD